MHKLILKSKFDSSFDNTFAHYIDMLEIPEDTIKII